MKTSQPGFRHHRAAASLISSQKVNPVGGIVPQLEGIKGNQGGSVAINSHLNRMGNQAFKTNQHLNRLRYESVDHAVKKSADNSITNDAHNIAFTAATTQNSQNGPASRIISNFKDPFNSYQVPNSGLMIGGLVRKRQKPRPTELQTKLTAALRLGLPNLRHEMPLLLKNRRSRENSSGATSIDHGLMISGN